MDEGAPDAPEPPEGGIVEPTDHDMEIKVRRVTSAQRGPLRHAIEDVLAEPEPGIWAGGQQVDTTMVDGEEKPVLQFPYVKYSASVDSLIEALYEASLIVPFDWMKWKGSGQTTELSLADAVRTITAAVRGERFGDGVLLEALKDGRMTRALERLRAALADNDSSSG